MKKRKWVRLLCSIITAGSMLMGTALAAEPVTPGNPNAVLVEVPDGVDVKREWISTDRDSLRGAGGWEDDVYYLPAGSTITLSRNPNFGGKIFSISVIDLTLEEKFINEGTYLQPTEAFICNGLNDERPSMEFTLETITTSYATLELVPGHLYTIKSGLEWNIENPSSTEECYAVADYMPVMYFRIADNAPQSAIATPTSSKVMVDGKTIAFDAYLIDGNNYFKLRDVAQVLSGSDKQFEITWDGAKNAINLIPGQSYTSVGGELAAGSGANQTAIPTSSTIYLDGKQISLTAYTIQGNNYFKLRDLGQTFDFGVGWDGANNTVTIDTSAGYTPE